MTGCSITRLGYVFRNLYIERSVRDNLAIAIKAAGVSFKIFMV